VTPTQLRAFAAVVRHGSVKDAAAELGVTEAAVSLHVGQLRRELGDQLFTRTASGIAFTPGGLRLASRAAEMLGLQDRTIQEVSQAARGRRMLRVAASSLFAEHAAPGLLELFTARADDLDVELSVRQPRQFGALLATRSVDIAIGPRPEPPPESVVERPFLNYQVEIVSAPDHPVLRVAPRVAQLREQVWLLGPSAAGAEGVMHTVLRQLDIPESAQRIFQSHSAALDEARRGHGLALAISFAVSADVAGGRLVRIPLPTSAGRGVWSAMTLDEHVPPAAAELVRFITTPRATQAMVRGKGVTIGHFRPSVHVTLWS
jgi:LysR family transcriptional regulator, low CO2-responsive transcriptional regulator